MKETYQQIKDRQHQESEALCLKHEEEIKEAAKECWHESLELYDRGGYTGVCGTINSKGLLQTKECIVVLAECKLCKKQFCYHLDISSFFDYCKTNHMPEPPSLRARDDS